ncbi:MAG: hypothetical protein QOF10_6112 [Kribbellaceae bacterium]|nr:hypothetical protein [Kribbellaceae bacterium]
MFLRVAVLLVEVFAIGAMAAVITHFSFQRSPARAALRPPALV